MLKLSEQLKKDHECGDFGKALAGYSERAAALESRVAELEAWQLTIAEGTGFINRAEGQSGYEVADPKTILEHFKEDGIERNRYRDALESIAEMTDADAEFNAAQTALEALEEFDHGDHADRP